MKKTLLTVTSTNLHRNYRKVWEIIKKSKQPIIILNRNKPELVAMDYNLYVKEFLPRLKK